MESEAKIVWLTAIDSNGKPIVNEVSGWDGKVPVGKIWRASNDPTNRGVWRWSMFAYARDCRGAGTLRRAGSAHLKEQAKIDCEHAYLQLLAGDPINRQAVHAFHVAAEEQSRIWEREEALRKAREPK
jgi:hypothetical protein